MQGCGTLKVVGSGSAVRMVTGEWSSEAKQPLASVRRWHLRPPAGRAQGFAQAGDPASLILSYLALALSWWCFGAGPFLLDAVRDHDVAVIPASSGCGPLFAALPRMPLAFLCASRVVCRPFFLAFGPPVEPGPPGALASFTNLLSGALRSLTFGRLLVGLCVLFSCRGFRASVSSSFLYSLDFRLEFAFYLGPVPACGAPCPVVQFVLHIRW